MPKIISFFYNRLVIMLLLVVSLTMTAFDAWAVCAAESSCNEGCGSCAYASTSGSSSTAHIVILLFVVFMLTVGLYNKYKNKLYLLGGVLVMSAISFGLYSVAPEGESSKLSPCSGCPSMSDTVVGQSAAVVSPDSLAALSADVQSKSLADTVGDGFEPVDDGFQTAGDEFQDASSDFVPMSELSSTSSQIEEPKHGIDYAHLYQLAVLAILLVIIGYMIKYENFRKTKGLFLVASVAYLGFYKGGCPCMISSFQNTVLSLMGSNVEWISMLWFLGLLPLTYFFGKVWCGWLCHLGGLQEILFQSSKISVLKSVKSQNILRYVRMGLLATLLVQLLITRTNLFIHYDPFKVAFNLFSANVTGYVLLVLLLVSSVLVYRPFCRAVCPVGLILGWVTLIPGARKLTKKEACVDCVACSRNCQTKALVYEDKKNHLQHQDCILCGDCMGSCNKNALGLFGSIRPLNRVSMKDHKGKSNCV